MSKFYHFQSRHFKQSVKTNERSFNNCYNKFKPVLLCVESENHCLKKIIIMFASNRWSWWDGERFIKIAQVLPLFLVRLLCSMDEYGIWNMDFKVLSTLVISILPTIPIIDDSFTSIFISLFYFFVFVSMRKTKYICERLEICPLEKKSDDLWKKLNNG